MDNKGKSTGNRKSGPANSSKLLFKISEDLPATQPCSLLQMRLNLSMAQAVPSGWTQADHALTRTIQRANFVEALAFVLEIAKEAEAVDHHPDIDIRYRTVHLSLSTHSAGNKVTAKDYALAQKINDLDENAIRAASDKLHEQFAA